MLLSNLLGNGAGFTPRWGRVMPGEIERVDVLCGPFSAACPGNSVGAVVDFVTRMPRQTGAHAKLDYFDQHFRERGTDGGFGSGDGSVALGLIRTNGIEIAATSKDAPFTDLDLAVSVTRTWSTILADANFPAAVGKLQPRVPKWRANLVATWRSTDAPTATLGVRYSSRRSNTLDNSDPNAFTYTGFSSFLVVDTRVRYRFDRNWSGSVDIDNLVNRKYWAFHPYPQRIYVAELGYDL